MTASTPLIPVTRTNTPARAFGFVIAASLLFLISSSAPAQRKSAAPADEESGVFQEYRGIQLGMTTDEVRKKLGNPKEKGDEQDFFMFGDKESAQIVYDKTHKVTTISADFLSLEVGVPTAKQVFGSEVEAKGDGSVYKIVRFPKAGYWVSFNRTGGNSPMISITLQKIQ
jgi:hypothetical protein